MVAELRGLHTVMRNLNREIKKIEGRTMQGLIEAARHIRYDMEVTSPIIPVDTGNLRQSWFTRALSTVGDITHFVALMIGFTASYAVWVHEMVGAHFKRPGSGAKFFEAALKRNKRVILNIIRKHARVR